MWDALSKDKSIEIDLLKSNKNNFRMFLYLKPGYLTNAFISDWITKVHYISLFPINIKQRYHGFVFSFSS